jgi:hypothetical protein
LEIPTATQAAEDGHDTLVRKLAEGFGLGRTFQTPPTRRSVTGKYPPPDAFCESPTAMQTTPALHETPLSKLAALGLGVGSIVQIPEPPVPPTG